MRTRTTTLAAASLAAAASVLTTTAHADVTGGDLTVVGNNFQVGNNYTVTTPVTAGYDWGSGLSNLPAGYGYLLDTVNGVTVTTGAWMSELVGTTQLQTGWTPRTAGTHNVTTFVTARDPEMSGSDRPAAALPDTPPITYGPATVTVAGTPTPATQGYTACSDLLSQYCFTVKGTPQVGCTLTITATSVIYPMNLGSATSESEAQTSTLTEAEKIIDNGRPLASITPGTGQTSYAWTPTTAGMHHLIGSVSSDSLSGTILWTGSGTAEDPGSAVDPTSGVPTGIGSGSNPLGDMWMPIAPAGTSTCA